MKADIRAKIKAAVGKYKSAILAGVACLVILTGILLLPGGQKASPTVNLSDFSSVNTICELATLKSYYHNIALYEQKPAGGSKFTNDFLFWPFGKYTKVGYKQFWMEYSGIVETGIDASGIQINGPDKNGVVEVYVPDAKVLSVYADETTLTEPLSEKGWFTSISGREKLDAFAAAQTNMRQEAEQDQVLLNRARNNAKLLLERYLINTGKEMGIEITVKWLDAPV